MNIGGMGGLDKILAKETSKGLSGESVVNTLTQNGKELSLNGIFSIANAEEAQPQTAEQEEQAKQKQKRLLADT